MSDIQEKIVSDWNKLDSDHKKFVLRAKDSGGGKHACEPHHVDTAELWDTRHPEFGFKQTSLWVKCEESGFVDCVGSYKWVSTAKFAALQAILFGFEE